MAKRSAEMKRLIKKAEAQAHTVAHFGRQHRPTVEIVRKTRTPKAKRKGGEGR